MNNGFGGSIEVLTQPLHTARFSAVTGLALAHNNLSFVAAIAP
jgi:hypothetical protein